MLEIIVMKYSCGDGHNENSRTSSHSNYDNCKMHACAYCHHCLEVTVVVIAMIMIIIIVMIIIVQYNTYLVDERSLEEVHQMCL